MPGCPLLLWRPQGRWSLTSRWEPDKICTTGPGPQATTVLLSQPRPGPIRACASPCSQHPTFVQAYSSAGPCCIDAEAATLLVEHVKLPSGTFPHTATRMPAASAYFMLKCCARGYVFHLISLTRCCCADTRRGRDTPAQPGRRRSYHRAYRQPRRAANHF